MRRYNLTPFQPSFFNDRWLADLAQPANRARSASLPPYDIIRGDDDQFELVIAAPGYADADIDVSEEDGRLTITAKGTQPEEEQGKYVRQGIARGGFQIEFELPQFVTAKSGRLSEGLLHIGLKKVVPDHLQPRRIAINTDAAEKAAA